jgi:hypothetical protein
MFSGLKLIYMSSFLRYRTEKSNHTTSSSAKSRDARFPVTLREALHEARASDIRALVVRAEGR